MSGADTASSAMAGFVAHLRANGFALGPRETAAALEALGSGGPFDARRARLSLKSVLVGRREEWERFDSLFEAYWFRRGRERSALTPDAAGHSGAARRLWESHLAAGRTRRAHHPRSVAGDDPTASEHPAGRAAASARSLQSRRDLRDIADPQELAEMEALAFRLARALRFRLSRRWAQRGRRRLDLRRTIRRSLARGGQPIELVRRARPTRPVRLVILLDVSGSMKPYARLLLQFVRGLVGAAIETEAFLFHTRLVKVSDAMREAEPMRAMARLSLLSQGFGGGTRIGHALKLFNDGHAAASLTSRSAVLILSDGYDTDSPESLDRELARLRRTAPRLLWLNPLARQQTEDARARAMDAAMPFVDFYGPAATIEDLEALEPELARL